MRFLFLLPVLSGVVIVGCNLKKGTDGSGGGGGSTTTSTASTTSTSSTTATGGSTTTSTGTTTTTSSAGGAGSTTATSSSTGGMGVECADCVDMACGAVATTCKDDPNCKSTLTCAVTDKCFADTGSAFTTCVGTCETNEGLTGQEKVTVDKEMSNLVTCSAGCKTECGGAMTSSSTGQ